MSKTKAPAAEPVAPQDDATADDAATQDQAPAAEPVAVVEVRALMTDATHALVAGAVALVPAEKVEALKAAGLVDDHPDAVAYAKARA
jgi:hypothetical protein